MVAVNSFDHEQISRFTHQTDLRSTETPGLRCKVMTGNWLVFFCSAASSSSWWSWPTELFKKKKKKVLHILIKNMCSVLRICRDCMFSIHCAPASWCWWRTCSPCGRCRGPHPGGPSHAGGCEPANRWPATWRLRPSHSDLQEEQAEGCKNTQKWAGRCPSVCLLNMHRLLNSLELLNKAKF